MNALEIIVLISAILKSHAFQPSTIHCPTVKTNTNGIHHFGKTKLSARFWWDTLPGNPTYKKKNVKKSWKDEKEELEKLLSETMSLVSEADAVMEEVSLALKIETDDLAHETKDWSKLTVNQLKFELKELGLAVGGKKSDLIARLEDYEASKKSIEEVEIVEAEKPITESAELETDDAEEPVANTDWSELTVNQLKYELKELGLAVGGKKSDLIARLEDYEASQTSSDIDEDVEAEPEEPILVEESSVAESAELETDDAEEPVIVEETSVTESAELETMGAEEPVATTDWSKLTVNELKFELKERGLAVGGKKADFVARLEDHEASQTSIDVDEDVEAETEEIKTVDKTEYQSKSVAQLKIELRSKNLPVGGKKEDLIQRLLSA